MSCRWAEEDRRTPRERTFPGLEVLGDLGHLDVGVKLVNLIQDVILIVVAKVIRRLLLGRHVRLDLSICTTNTFGLGADPTMLRSWPRVIESRPRFVDWPGAFSDCIWRGVGLCYGYRRGRPRLRGGRLPRGSADHPAVAFL